MVLLRPVLLYVAIVLILAVAFSLACGNGGSGGAAPQASKNATPPPDANAIRQVELSKDPAIAALMARLGGGTPARDDVVYADLTGDLREEAIVPIASGGTLGNIAYVVLTLRDGTTASVLDRTTDRNSAGGLKVAVEDGRLIETSGEFGPEDPFCCPSVLRKTYFRWDGSKLRVDREEKVASPSGPKH